MNLLSPNVSKLTPWVITTGESSAVSFGELLIGGITAFSFFLAKDVQADPAAKFQMRFAGAGQGFGIGLPLDISYGPSQLPGIGVIYAGGQAPAQSGLRIDDFAGRCTVHVFGAAMIGGVSSVVIYFGSDIPKGKVARAVGVISGTSIGTPGVSAMEYHGKIWRV